MLPDLSNYFTNFLALESILGCSGQLEKRMENDASGRILYLGYAVKENASTSDPIWMIRKFSYDSNNFLNRDQLPSAGNGFLYVWDLRSAYFS